METLTDLLRALTLLIAPLLQAKSGLGTVFLPEGDRFNPNPTLACYYPRKLSWKDVVVAHPTLPCRSRVWIYNPRTRRSVIATVADRGPRRAMIDIAPATARALRHNGYETLFMAPLRAK